MFLPRNKEEEEKNASEAVAKKRAITEIETWAMEAIPETLREGVMIMVQEVQCGDPNCSPVDTAIAILYPSGQRGMLGIPMEVQSVTRYDLLEVFPPKEILTAWKNGEDAEWPPMFDDDDDDDEDPTPEIQFPPLRFPVGQRVECRVGAHNETGWASGTIVQLWYRDQEWPPGSYAPYIVELDDGRKIYAPGDADQIIRIEERRYERIWGTRTGTGGIW